jgi:DNA/RNA endonuclease YhcR with UshA esterase domain
MKLQNLTLILALLGILTLALFSQAKPIQTGTISQIQKSQYKTTIQLENHAAKLIIFDTPILDLKQGDKIHFQGKSDVYKNEEQIIISKISKIKTS